MPTSNSKKKKYQDSLKDTLLGDYIQWMFKHVGIPFLVLVGVVTCTDLCISDPVPTQYPKNAWKNWDPEKDPITEIASLNYETREVEYKRHDIPRKDPYIYKSTIGDEITEHVLENMDIEELWDRISDEGYGKGW